MQPRTKIVFFPVGKENLVSAISEMKHIHFKFNTFLPADSFMENVKLDRQVLCFNV